MNRLIIFIFLVLNLSATAQKDYFVYIQTENNQPFFVRMQDRNYASSANGYLILPRLRDSIYQLNIGFPQAKWPDQRFNVTIAGRDRGFLLKLFEDSGWGLFDLQTLAVLKPETVAVQPKPETPANVSPFTAVLAKAANDPTLGSRKPAPVKEKEPAATAAVTPKPVETRPVTGQTTDKPALQIVSGDTVLVALQDIGTINTKPAPAASETVTKPLSTPVADTVLVVPVNNAPVVSATPDLAPAGKPVMPATEVKQNSIIPEVDKTDVTAALPRSQVSRRSESSTSEGFGLVFIDKYEDGNADTIRILIPNPKLDIRSEERKDEGKRFLDISSDVAVDTTAPKKSNSCNSIASENDFLQLRKKMAAQKADDAMIAEARKAFRQKCYSVKYLRNLSVLFLNDAARYQFFEIAYQRAADPEVFESLGAELKNEYYNRRFIELLGNK